MLKPQRANRVADDDGAAGLNYFSGGDGLAEDAAGEDVTDDFKLGEFGHWRRGLHA